MMWCLHSTFYAMVEMRRMNQVRLYISTPENLPDFLLCLQPVQLAHESALQLNLYAPNQCVHEKCLHCASIAMLHFPICIFFNFIYLFIFVKVSHEYKFIYLAKLNNVRVYTALDTRVTNGSENS